MTRFRYRLQPVDQIVGGVLILPASADLIVRAIEAAEAAPEELSSIVNIMPAPPMPFVPEAFHGRLVALMLLCYAGNADAGARAIAPFRALATPIADMVRPMRYPEIFPPDDPSYHPTALGRTMFVDRVDRPAAETMIDFLERSDASMRVAQLRVLGRCDGARPGRRHRVCASAGANSGECRFVLRGTRGSAIRDAWTRDFAAALNQGRNGAYVAFLGDEGEAGVRAAYPGATRDRLRTIKARYDPTNLFRLNHNIAPARV